MPANSVAAILGRLLVCFFAGSIPFAVLAMMGTGIDIRKVGSGNPGFNNVLRVSKARAVVTLIGDMGKGALAIWVVLHFWPVLNESGTGSVARGVGFSIPESPVTLGWLYGFSAILGHCFSPFLRFNGGKGIATSGGVMLVLYPLWAVVSLVYFGTARIALGHRKWPEAGMIASVSTWVLFTLLMFAFVGRLDASFAALMTFFLGWRHRKNFENLKAAFSRQAAG